MTFDTIRDTIQNPSLMKSTITIKIALFLASIGIALILYIFVYGCHVAKTTVY